MAKRSALLLVMMLLSHANTWAEELKPLVEVLQSRSADRQLEITFADGWFARGYVVAAGPDSVHLRQKEMSGVVTTYPLGKIVRVREWRSNASTGASVGAATGGIIVGGFGLLVGAYVASINDHDDSDVPAYVIGTVMGVGAGIIAGGTLGLGVGALSSSWHHIWPDGFEPAKEDVNPYSEETRVGLFAGVGTTLLEDYQVTRFVGRASVRKNVGSSLSMGPELSYHDFGDERTTTDSETIRHHDNLIKFAFVTNIAQRTPGLTPFATLGVGWFLSNDAYLGGHVGGGLRHQYSGGNDLEFDVRYHFSFTTVDPDEVDQFWTVGLSFGFGL